MPVTTDPLTMSQAPSKEYLQGWNDCHKHMAEEIVRQDTQIEQYDLTIRGMTEKNDELREAGRKSADDAASALDLLSRIRFALGDNGTRMQDELLEYCRELRDSAGALAALGEEYDALRSELKTWQDGCACTDKSRAEVLAIRARVAELETAGAELLDAYQADVNANLAHVKFSIPPGPDPSAAAERLDGAVDAFAFALNSEQCPSGGTNDRAHEHRDGR